MSWVLFASQAGLGSRIVTEMLIKADAMSALADVNVVTFSSGIFDANTFIGVGGKGLKFGLTVNQDPALGATMSGGRPKQYLSGWTTNGPRAGFEFLPIFRWQKDFKFEEMKRALGKSICTRGRSRITHSAWPCALDQAEGTFFAIVAGCA